MARPGIGWRSMALVVIASAATTARAEPALSGGDDGVTLKNGGMVRGTIVSIEPNQELVIVVGGTGEPRHLRWSDVDKVEPRKFAPAALPAPITAPTDYFTSLAFGGAFAPPLPAPTTPQLGAPRIHIKSDFPVTLHEVTPTLVGPVREITCQAPCDKIVDGRANQTFYFAGDEIPQSARFHLIEKSGDVIAHVKAGNETLPKVGSALLVPGILTTIGGSAILPFALLTDDPQKADDLKLATGIVLGAGVAALVSAITLLVVGRTRYEFTNAAGLNGVQF